MKKYLFYILFLLANSTVYAQNNLVDSLKTALINHQQEDTKRVDLMNETIRHLGSHRTDSLMIASEALSKKLNYTKGLAVITNFKGYDQIDIGNFPKAIEYFEESLSLFTLIDFKIGMSNCLNSIGNANCYQSDYEKALPYYQQSLSLDKELNDSAGISFNYNNIGNVYADLGEYDKAIEAYLEAKEIDVAMNNKPGIARIYNNIATIYGEQGNFPLAIQNLNEGLKLFNDNEEGLKSSLLLSNLANIYLQQNKLEEALFYMNKELSIVHKNENQIERVNGMNTIGKIYLMQGKTEEALDYHNQALELSKAINYKNGIAKSLINIADLKFSQEKYNEVLPLYQKALDINKEIENPFWTCTSHLGLAKIYTKENKHQLALEHALDGREIATSLHLLEEGKVANDLLFKNYKALNDFENALKSHEKYKLLNDSLFNKENVERITELEYEYKYQAQLALANEREMTLTNKIDVTSQNLEKSQRNSLFGIIGILLLAIISGATIFYLKLKEQREKVNAIVNEQKLLRSQMTPHFIFNSLSVLQGIILNKEENKSVFYLSKFSKLLRTILENSREKTVSLQQELSAIEDYIILQNINIEPPCEYSILVDENIDTSLFNIPPMLIQPFIENVIEHAFGIEIRDKELRIQLSLKKDKLICTITDNGVGINKHSTEFNNNSKKSLATTITSERLDVLSKDFKFKGNVIVEDRSKYNEQGTLVTLTIPYIKK